MAPFAAVVLLISAISGLLAATKEPAYSSEKPLYAFVVLNEEATKVLKLVLDESRGTGNGYDTIHADLNLNGDLTDDRAVKGTMRKSERTIACSFPAINVPVPYKEKGRGVDKPWEIRISYVQFDNPAGIDRRCSLDAKCSDS